MFRTMLVLSFAVADFGACCLFDVACGVSIKWAANVCCGVVGGLIVLATYRETPRA